MEENIQGNYRHHSRLLADQLSSNLTLHRSSPLPTDNYHASATSSRTYFLSSASSQLDSTTVSSSAGLAEASVSGGGQSRRRSQLYNQTSQPSASTSFWNEEEHPLPPFHPFDHMTNLLSQLGSSISVMEAAYRHLQTAMTPANLRDQMCPPAEKNMLEQLQRLSDLHLQLVMMQHMQQDHYNEEKEKKGAMLKSYEGIITRFHDEIRRKDAVAEGLKETLAKSMLKSEKLERRLKSLQTKLATPVSNQI